MKTCNRCLYPVNHPLNIIFDDDGICSGCRIHEEKDVIDWSLKEKKLLKILSNYKNTSGNNYDCIIPVSGAKDSFFIVHMVKNVYGMNPLLLTYNKQYNNDLGIRNLAKLRTQFDCDLMNLTVNPNTVKKVTKASLRKFGSIYWHCIAGQTVFPVQIAVKFKIPLIIWGAHQGVDQVGMFSHNDEVEMTRKYRKEHDLMGFEAEDLVSEFDNISLNDIGQFLYPDDIEIAKVGVRGIYLNNYIRWDSKKQHEKMIEIYDYESNMASRTFDLYNYADCFNYTELHDYIKFIKHGYGVVTDNVCREIRLRRMTREQGLDLINKYKLSKPKNVKLFLDWLGITENGFDFLIDQHRNSNIWERDNNWKWKIRKDYFELNDKNSVEKARLSIKESWKDFQNTKNKRKNYTDDKYILLGKGHY